MCNYKYLYLINCLCLHMCSIDILTDKQIHFFYIRIHVDIISNVQNTTDTWCMLTRTVRCVSTSMWRRCGRHVGARRTGAVPHSPISPAPVVEGRAWVKVIAGEQLYLCLFSKSKSPRIDCNFRLKIEPVVQFLRFIAPVNLCIRSQLSLFFVFRQSRE